MRLADPFSWLNEAVHKRALGGLIVLSVLLMLAMGTLDQQIRTPEAMFGIGSFELARTLEASQRILASWDPTARIYVALSLGLDYLFLAVYSLSIALACVRVAAALRSRSSGLANLGLWLAWGQLAAALLDAVENYALIRVLVGAQEAIWPGLAWACALPKFAIVTLGLVYVLLGAPAAFVLARREQQNI